MLTMNIHEGKMQNVLSSFPSESIDVIFADPPYNIQNKKDKRVKYSTSDAMISKNWTPHYADYDTVDDYDTFANEFLTACKRVLKPKGSIFVTGTYHNIHTIALHLKQLGYWCVAEIAWCKPNAMPNLAMYGPTQAVEWILWYRKSEKDTHYYDKTAAKAYNNGVNIKTYWVIPKPSDRQIKYPGRKPESLIYRCIDLSTKKDGEITILDPCCGSGSTGDAARYIHQKYDIPVTCHLVDESPDAIKVTRQRLSLSMKPKDFYM